MLNYNCELICWLVLSPVTRAADHPYYSGQVNGVICKLELQIIKGLLKAKETIWVTVLTGFKKFWKMWLPFLQHSLLFVSPLFVVTLLNQFPNEFSDLSLLYCKATISVLPQTLGCSQANASDSALAVLILTRTEGKKRAWEISGVLCFLFMLIMLL